MGSIFHQDMLDFMMQLRLNNNKAFMEAHRAEYISKMRDPYYKLIEQLAPVMLKIDPQMETRPQKVLSRIFRDTRFSKDKSPYRDHHWIAFRRAGEARDQSLMFWFEIRIESVSWGLGYWGENRQAMDILRRRMLAYPGQLLELLPDVQKNKFVLDGEIYKRMAIPDKLPAVLKPWYPLKELYLMKSGINPAWVFQADLGKRLSDDYLLLAPMYHYLRGNLDPGTEFIL